MTMHSSVTRTILLFWLCVTSRYCRALTQIDPCVSYREVDDKTKLTSYQQTSNCSRLISQTGWTRFNTTNTGMMATSCPSGTQCGCGQQMWINDTLPSCADNITLVYACIRVQNNCCERKGPIEIKMCNGFMVFNNPASLPQRTVICFANDSVTLPGPTCSTTTPMTSNVSGSNTREITSQTTTTQQVSRETILNDTNTHVLVPPVSVIRNNPENEVFTLEGILLGFSVGLVAGLASSIAFHLYRKRKKVHSIRNKIEDVSLQGGNRSDNVAKPMFTINRWYEEQPSST